MRCRYASELGLHVEVGPLIIATLVSPCALAALSHPPPISFRRGKVQCTHFQARARSTFAGSRPNIHAKHMKMCWNTSLPRIANEDARVFFDPGYFSICSFALLSLIIRARLQDVLHWSVKLTGVEYYFEIFKLLDTDIWSFLEMFRNWSIDSFWYFIRRFCFSVFTFEVAREYLDILELINIEG